MKVLINKSTYLELEGPIYGENGEVVGGWVVNGNWYMRIKGDTIEASDHDGRVVSVSSFRSLEVLK